MSMNCDRMTVKYYKSAHWVCGEGERGGLTAAEPHPSAAVRALSPPSPLRHQTVTSASSTETRLVERRRIVGRKMGGGHCRETQQWVATAARPRESWLPTSLVRQAVWTLYKLVSPIQIACTLLLLLLPQETPPDVRDTGGLFTLLVKSMSCYRNKANPL